ncbi:MAG TPA: enoyl-CoA hydratase/isomerase family protein [Casimicrobiaceae bacterium]|jgi:enoyl-CoA hydratase/carnithine racemase
MHADGPPTLDVAGPIATVRLRRPAQHNRIDPDDVAVMRGYLSEGKLDPAVRALVFTGTGETTFSSGYTVDAIVGRLNRDFEELLDTIEQFPLPTICALNGSVYGGGIDLALCCDFRLGVRGSRMFMPAAKFALHYYPAGLRRAVAALGAAQAKRVFLTAQTLDAAEMLRIGFLTELTEPGDLAGRVDAYIAALADCDPGVVTSMKHQIGAIAAGDPVRGESRAEYEASLASEELRRRLARTRR